MVLRILTPLLLLAQTILIFSAAGCVKPKVGSEVILYASVDQVFAQPVLQIFEEKEGIRVKPVYDVEAAKTTGMVNRIIAEQQNPVADVFWSGEVIQTILLAEKGALEPYKSLAMGDIPKEFYDPSFRWIGLGGRARVIMVNTSLLAPGQYPDSVFDLLDPQYPADKIAVANPLFGTTSTFAAGLYSKLGRDRARDFFKKLKQRKVRIVDGNSTVRNLVAGGQALWGLTDTDDALGAIKGGAPCQIIIPDQKVNETGTLIIPNTIALIKGARHRQEAERLIDFILSLSTEKKLNDMGWIQVSFRQKSIYDAGDIKVMNVSFESMYRQLGFVKKDLSEIFIR